MSPYLKSSDIEAFLTEFDLPPRLRKVLTRYQDFTRHPPRYANLIRMSSERPTLIRAYGGEMVISAKVSPESILYQVPDLSSDLKARYGTQPKVTTIALTEFFKDIVWNAVYLQGKYGKKAKIEVIADDVVNKQLIPLLESVGFVDESVGGSRASRLSLVLQRR